MKVGKAKKTLYIADCLGWFPFMDGFYLCRVHGNTIVADDEPEERSLGD